MTIDRVKLRDKKNTIYLPSTSYKDFYRNNFTIVYPNGGTKEAPANITTTSRYIIENPFPGYYVSCSPEIFIEGEWGTVPWDSYYANGHYGHGLSCGQNNDNNIILITGSRMLTDRIDSYQYQNKIGGAVFTKISYDIKTAPARIKIWKVGKIK